MATGSPPDAPSPALVFDTLLAYQRSAALVAAIELDLFLAVGEGSADVATLAQRCSASERGVRILCDYLTIIGLLKKEAGHYYHTPTSAVFLDPRSPSCLASTSLFLANATMVEPCARLAEIVRTGTTVLPGHASLEPDNPLWVDFAHSMAPMMAPMAAPLGTIVLEGFSGPIRVLDIAAGHGLFGIEVAKQNPQADILAIDWAPVLNVARANAEKAGVAERYVTLPGNAFDVDFHGPHEIVLLTNFLHHFDPPTCITILRKVRACLKPGGRAAALEFVPNEDRVSPPIAAAFGLVMLTTTPSGDVHTFCELESMFRAAGFDSVSRHPLPTGPHTLVVGHVAGSAG